MVGRLVRSQWREGWWDHTGGKARGITIEGRQVGSEWREG